MLRTYILLTDTLTMLGRPAESARLAETAIEAMRPYGIDTTVLDANRIEILLDIGEWDRADTLSAAALRSVTANYAYMPLMIRAILETGRGDFAHARARLDAARPILRLDRDVAMHDGYVAHLALWERRWVDAEEAVRDGLARTRSREAAQIRVWLCAEGLRAQAELAALARARRDADGVRDRLDRARKLRAIARRAAAEASTVTPTAAGWRALADAEHERARGDARPDLWAAAAGAWDGLGRAPLAAYCRWRQAEAMVAVGARRAETGVPLRQAYAVATRIGAAPLARELEVLAGRARLDLAEPAARSVDGNVLGLTAREAEVLALVARGMTNRDIAAALVISVKTASVHVSHILRKLDAPNRGEAAAIAHRVGPPA